MIIGESANAGKKAAKLTGKLLRKVAVVGGAGVVAGIAGMKSKQAISDIKDIVIQLYNLAKNTF